MHSYKGSLIICALVHHNHGRPTIICVEVHNDNVSPTIICVIVHCKNGRPTIICAIVHTSNGRPTITGIVHQNSGALINCHSFPCVWLALLLLLLRFRQALVHGAPTGQM